MLNCGSSSGARLDMNLFIQILHSLVNSSDLPDLLRARDSEIVDLSSVFIGIRITLLRGCEFRGPDSDRRQVWGIK